MKHIIKNPEPAPFSAWKSNFPTAKFTDMGNERLFRGGATAKRALRCSLLDEQGGLCCYCESRIAEPDFHIEHFRPKDTSLFPHLQLDYINLHACCRAMPIGEPDDCCGHKKKNIFHEDLVSPLESDCATHFAYDMMGGISSTDARGATSIAILNLDSGALRRSRRGLIEYFESLPEDELEEEINLHLAPNHNPLGEFYTTIYYLQANHLL